MKSIKKFFRKSIFLKKSFHLFFLHTYFYKLLNFSKRCFYFSFFYFKMASSMQSPSDNREKQDCFSSQEDNKKSEPPLSRFSKDVLNYIETKTMRIDPGDLGNKECPQCKTIKAISEFPLYWKTIHLIFCQDCWISNKRNAQECHKFICEQCFGRFPSSYESHHANGWCRNCHRLSQQK